MDESNQVVPAFEHMSESHSCNLEDCPPPPEPMTQACEGSWRRTNNCVEECNVAQTETLTIVVENELGGAECRETDDLPLIAGPDSAPMSLVSYTCPHMHDDGWLDGCQNGATRR